MSQKVDDKKEMLNKQLNDVSKKAKNILTKASEMVSKSSGIKQLAIGSISGWTTGFLATKVGKTVAISVGGSVILIAAANQAGIVNIDWEKIGKKVGDTTSKVESKLCETAPNLKANVGRYARTNTLFAAGFVGGFLLGLAS